MTTPTIKPIPAPATLLSMTYTVLHELGYSHADLDAMPRDKFKRVWAIAQTTAKRRLERPDMTPEDVMRATVDAVMDEIGRLELRPTAVFADVPPVVRLGQGSYVKDWPAISPPGME